jgi:DNA polymerase III subunit gamma/tau
MAEASHLVLARKWRPEQFSELVGQEHVTRTLAEALRRGRIAHAFLFTGIRGVGKTTAARILARCLNCERGPTAEPCGECAACEEIRAGRSLDVSEIDGATYRKIDDARAIIENLSYRPARDRFKIYIIDEAHQLTDQAFNALLKTLEEPPAHVKFILATTEPQKMPETILSRLQRYDFRRIPFATILARLTDLCAREKIATEEGAVRLIAREAGGSMRDGERMLETAIATAPAGGITEAEVAASLGVASRTAVFGLIDAILAHNAAGALKIVRELATRGANLESLGRDLLESLRNLAIAKLPSGGGRSPLDELPDHEAQEMRRLSAGSSARDVMRLFRLMAASQEEIARTPYPDLLLEMAVIRMASLAPVLDADELMRALGAAGAGGAPPSKPPTSASPAGGASGERIGSAPPHAAGAGARRLKVEGEVKADAPRRAPASAQGIQPLDEPPPAAASDLPELREHIRRRRAALAGFMEQGAALGLDRDVVVVIPRNDIYIRYLSDNRQALAELASEHYGRPIRVEIAGDAERPVKNAQLAPPAAQQLASAPVQASADDPARVKSAPAPAADRADTQPPAARPKNPADERQVLYSDPAIRRIFDAFEARLVEVRSAPAPTPSSQPDAPQPSPDAGADDEPGAN